MVFNPHAAYRRAGRLLPKISQALQAFARVDVLQTTGAGDAERQVAATPLTDYDGLIAAGGDGTLFEVLNGLYRHEASRRIPLGLLPVGTGNAFARDLGLLPGDWEKGVALIGKAHLRRVDVGRVDQGQGDGTGQPFHFLNIIGAGLPVDAMRTAERIKFVGRSAYSLAAFWRAMRLKTFPLSMELDGELIEQDALFLEVSNTRYTGTHFLMAPGAQFDDGLLDITLVRRLPRRRLVRLFPSIYNGRHVEYPEVLTRRARTVRINGPAGLELAPDGEFQGRAPARITCLHRDLEIFARGRQG
jgi:diacylglycerol kinase (ATP)